MALVAGVIALIRYKAISSLNLTGRIYVITTILTCITGFGIFQHGGFGKAHALGVMTLVVLAAAPGAEKSSMFGKVSPYTNRLKLLHFTPRSRRPRSAILR